jgi:hypothetical protein
MFSSPSNTRNHLRPIKEFLRNDFGLRRQQRPRRLDPAVRVIVITGAGRAFSTAPISLGFSATWRVLREAVVHFSGQATR